ncbi:MAG TPA: hypothetical protein VFL70_01225 [Bacteroidia bacterium]|nr:hypothetical protein [Bacteroidia bacterium]
MKKFSCYSIIIIAFFSFFVTACCSKKKAAISSETKTETPAAQPKMDFEKNGYIKATIINYEVDGCGFLIQLEDGKKLQPANLSSDYKKDKLPVWVKYAPKKGGMSVCMAGQMIELSDIQLRK